MVSIRKSRDREHPSPIFIENIFKLGVFGFPAGNGCAVTIASKRHVLNQDRDLKMAQAADRLGLPGR